MWLLRSDQPISISRTRVQHDHNNEQNDQNEFFITLDF